MKRRERIRGVGEVRQAWLITFSDLMTLLLAFFVLLLSMSAVDTPQVTRVVDALRDYAGQGVATGPSVDRIRHLRSLLQNAEALRGHEGEVRSLLFPPQVLPPGVDIRTVERRVSVMEHPEGVVIMLSHDLIFPAGGDRLPAASLQLLGAVGEVLAAMSAEVHVSAYTSREESGMDTWELSSRRALGVLEYFLQAGLDPVRFSAAGYGQELSRSAGAAGEGAMPEGRVDILVKTARR